MIIAAQPNRLNEYEDQAKKIFYHDYFENRIKTFPIICRFKKRVYQSQFINYTTLFHNLKHHIGIGNQIKINKNKNNRLQYCCSLQYIHTLYPQLHLGIRLNRKTKNSNLDFSIYKYINDFSSLTFCYNIDPKYQTQQKFIFNYKESAISIKEDKLKLKLQIGNVIQPYVKTDLRTFSKVIFGVKAKLKDFELFAYKEISKKEEQSSLSLGVMLNILDWKVGLKMNFKENNSYFALFIQKFGLAIQFPFYSLIYNDLLEKYTIAAFGFMIGCSILKCFQQPKVLPLNKQQRIEQSRNQLNLLEHKTKQNFRYEKENNGLLILFAYYGNAEHIKLLSQQQNKSKYHLQNDLEIIDVTLSCQFNVKNSKLHLPKYSKSVLFGFCDPCENTNTHKLLLFEYTYKQQKFNQIFDDLDEVILP
ncbi:unnamed protein product [Paramecium pentaurelia]|uniref:DnaJ-like protein C11 C-terminal domain-containing protein n=1 Tax=Paramecium pentaurelia TaxID=43138 RepID=A0A8S1YB92_9CILI|nr:unnamed protein product [Paramecium pentaurelia]